MEGRFLAHIMISIRIIERALMQQLCLRLSLQHLHSLPVDLWRPVPEA
jgi:hypothetical protein